MNNGEGTVGEPRSIMGLLQGLVKGSTSQHGFVCNQVPVHVVIWRGLIRRVSHLGRLGSVGECPRAHGGNIPPFLLTPSVRHPLGSWALGPASRHPRPGSRLLSFQSCKFGLAGALQSCRLRCGTACAGSSGGDGVASRRQAVCTAMLVGRTVAHVFDPSIPAGRLQVPPIPGGGPPPAHGE